MKTYELYIKSNYEAPDYEDSVMAENKLQAANLFAQSVPKGEGSDWGAVDLLPYIQEAE